jgi:malonyl-CoA decarboxylase
MTVRQSLRRGYHFDLNAPRIFPLLLQGTRPRLPRRRFYYAAIYYFRSFHPLSSTASLAYAVTYPRPFVVYPSARSSLGVKSCFSTTSNNNNIMDNHQQVLLSLQNLVARLEEWEPNLSPPPSSSSSLEEPTAASELPSSLTKLPAGPGEAKNLSIEEYARIFCGGYVRLPPLQLGWIAESLASPSTLKQDANEKHDWNCPRSAIVFFLAIDCGVSSPALSRFLDHLRDHTDATKNPLTVLKQLRKLGTPKFDDVFQCLFEHNSKQTLTMLVQLRGDLLGLMALVPKSHDHDQTLGDALQQLERHLRRLLSAWFSPGMLEIRRITFDTTSAGIIEKIAIKEAVHPMKGLDDLRRRLGPQRRVFALFHPLLLDEPLVILHVHLETKNSNDNSHIPASMTHVFAEAENTELPSPPRVATFYSISNTQAGLTRGLGLGEFLIKQAVKCLQQEFPSGSIETFVTLSPMPGFRKWMEGLLTAVADEDDQVWAQRLADRGMTSSLVTTLINSRSELEQVLFRGKGGGNVTTDRSVGSYSHEQEVRSSIEEQLERIKPTLMRLAGHYLVLAKNHRSGKPLDPVTGFHVHNGAEVFRINFAADLSPKGLQRSCGVMVNYRYRLEQLESNQAMYESSHFKEIPMTTTVRDLLDKE